MNTETVIATLSNPMRIALRGADPRRGVFGYMAADTAQALIRRGLLAVHRSGIVILTPTGMRVSRRLARA